MFTVTTATGKQFESDYAVQSQRAGIAFVNVLGKSKEEVESIFRNPAEFPLDCFPQYDTLDDILYDDTSTKLLLKRG